LSVQPQLAHAKAALEGKAAASAKISGVEFFTKVFDEVAKLARAKGSTPREATEIGARFKQLNSSNSPIR
jgi:hypothetical protein